MPARRDQQTRPRTRLVEVRVQRGVTREALAAAIGVSVSTLRDIEVGVNRSPKLPVIANAAIVLGVEPEVIWPQLRDWTPFSKQTERPPDPREFWFSAPFADHQTRRKWSEGGPAPALKLDRKGRARRH